MESSPISSSHNTGATWQLLGEFDLTNRPPADTIRAWLEELLTPLNLHDELANQLLGSAQDATIRALNSYNETSFEHIHLSVFVPKERDWQRNNWGFFRVEKIGSAEQNEDHPEYVVEFYLYLDG